MREQTLKPGWKRVKFGDVVRQVKDKVDVESAGLDRYIAGEHMDTDDLRIRRWGTIDDGYLGPAFHMRFKSGQVLYGSRRTYLRKVAVPDFEGICANTTFVLEAKDPTILLPELLPFIMQTEAFNDHSVKQSKGSVNPYVNFSDLAWYEFALPPLEEQRQLALCLHSVGTQLESLINVKETLRNLRQSLEKEVFLLDKWTEKVALKSLLESGSLSLQTGPFGTVLKASSYKECGHPVINPSDMVEGKINLDRCKFVDHADWNRLHQYQLKPDDMVIGRKGDMQNLVFMLPEYKDYLLGSDCIRFRVHDITLHPKFLFCFLRAEVTRQWLQSRAYGTIMPGINEKLLARMLIPLPAKEVQDEVVEQFNFIDGSQEQLERRMLENRQLKSALLQTCLV